MKLRAIFRFELGYQLRRVQTWLFFALLGVVAFVATRENFLADARNGGFLLNSPTVIADVTVLCSMLWLLAAAAVAGEAAARDVATRMHPLTYTAPVSKAEYLGGRYLAAFVVNALVLLAVPVGFLLAVYVPGVEAEMLGPFRPAAYISSYALIGLSNAFVATAIQFAFAALGRRPVAGYIGGLLLLVTAFLVGLLDRELGRLLDPIGLIALSGGDATNGWTPVALNTRLIALEGSWLTNRLMWLGIALGTLAFTHVRFRFGHPAEGARRSRVTKRRHADSAAPAVLSVPQVRRTFGFATYVRQTLAIARVSFGNIVKSWGGLVLLVVVGLLAYLSVGEILMHMGGALLPRTDFVLHGLLFPEVPPAWLIVPLLIVFWSGNLVWREREAGVSPIVDTAPVPEWVLFLGKFLGLGLVLAACMAIRMAVGMLVQAGTGYYDFEVGLYLRLLFGIQLLDYLLLALLALVVHVVVDQRHVGHLAALIAIGLALFFSGNESVHKLLVYGSGPRWTYTNMRGFGHSLAPWLWFKAYWTAWALLLAVVARLLWVRGREGGLRLRLQTARRRFTPPTAWAAAAAVGLILSLGGYIFYNTNVLNQFATAADRMEQSAEYERRYGQYAGVPQPQLTGTNLHVEIDPERRAVEIRGTYQLVNESPVPINSVHLATVPEVETGGIEFDRPAKLVVGDEALGRRIYALDMPLQPGDSLRLSFDVHFEPKGFRNSGVDAAVVANGTYFTNRDWLPAIGYQPNRDGRTAFEAVVGTNEGQIAVAPGTLRESWTEGGRRYFRYVAEAPIGNEYAFFSAVYAVHEGRWNDVAIQVFHDPGQTANLDRMVRSVQAALSYYTKQFGPFPHSQVRLVERPGHGVVVHAKANTIEYQEGFALLSPEDGPQGVDVPLYLVAHEVARQWFGGAESLTAYAAFQVVKDTYGAEHLDRLLSQLRESTDRKDLFALYELSEQIGEERVNEALRRRELPDSLKYLLHDLSS
ncbi:MAG TPA: hypothetical protein VNT75_30290 [Symbiobacteriaceae bacterium]|nr:hypothetical protein [Symbiobacteriaceae bacterium]